MRRVLTRVAFVPDYMFYTRGSSDEFDRLARISGDEGWSWNAMLPYILKASLSSSLGRGLSASQH